MTVSTAFDALEHGWKFPNSFDVPTSLDVLRDTIGLCGGMCFTALDRYYSEEPIPDTTSTPRPGSSLFNEIFNRQIDNIRVQELIIKCLDWSLRQDYKGEYYWLPYCDEWDSVGELSIRSWNNTIAPRLDDGLPTVIVLCKVGGLDIWGNHQVIATGYEIFGSNRISIECYDPNYPKHYSAVTFQKDTDEYRINAKCGRKDGTRHNIRGFFFWDYDRKERVISPTITPLEETSARLDIDDLSWFWILHR